MFSLFVDPIYIATIGLRNCTVTMKNSIAWICCLIDCRAYVPYTPKKSLNLKAILSKNVRSVMFEMKPDRVCLVLGFIISILVYGFVQLAAGPNHTVITIERTTCYAPLLSSGVLHKT
jgi:hypothetical protein